MSKYAKERLWLLKINKILKKEIQIERAGSTLKLNNKKFF
jgi:hypothetical protein